jgi:dipeptidyl aminopeptidase/acylaminoacyl peptidase
MIIFRDQVSRGSPHFLFLLALVTALLLGGCNGNAVAQQATLSHPDRRGATIEYFIEHPKGSGPWPTVVFLHGYQSPTAQIGGRAFVNWGVLKQYAKKGYLAVSVSLPGYGQSSGPADFAGPFTQHAVQAVLAKLKHDRLAIPDKILIQGVSLGAVTGALVAAKDKQVAGLVLISGLYDLPAFFADPNTPNAQMVKAAAIRQTGGSKEAFLMRSALPLAQDIRAVTLILNGAKDDRTDARQAQRFAAAINTNGGRASVHIFPDYGHEIPFKIRDAEVSAFIDATLRK